MAKIHIGKKIKEVWKASRIKGTEFASLINKDRQVIYDIFERETIDTGLLERVGNALNHNFFIYYVQTSQFKENKTQYGYASQVDVDHLTDLVKKLAIEVEKLHEKIPAKQAVKKTKPKK